MGGNEPQGSEQTDRSDPDRQLLGQDSPKRPNAVNWGTWASTAGGCRRVQVLTTAKSRGAKGRENQAYCAGKRPDSVKKICTAKRDKPLPAGSEKGGGGFGA